MYAFLTLAANLALSQAEPAAVPPASTAAPAAIPAPPATPPATPIPTRPVRPERGDAGGGAKPRDVPAAPAPAPKPPALPAETEKAQVARAALRFLDALVAADADALASAGAERFSFDGDVQSGRDAVRRAWRTLLGRREAPRAEVLDLDVLPAPEAVARYGAPPPRVAGLAARGAWVAVANVSGRPVVLFLVKDGGRWAIAGMHG